MAMTQTIDSHSATERRRDIDLLRTLMVFGLVFFHTVRVFDVLPMPEGVKNEPDSALATVVTAFFALWAMPLMFYISGFAIQNSLRKRTGGAFLLERLQRLVVPFVFGVLAIVPPQYYIHALGTDPATAGSYWHFLGRFFDVRLCFNYPNVLCADPRSGLFGIAQLWFLWALFVFSVVLMPLFLWLRGSRGMRAIDALGRHAERPGAILLWALPLALIDAAIVIPGNPYAGGWSQLTFMVFLVYGYVIAADRRLGAALGRVWRSALAIGVVAALAYIAGLYWFIEVAHLDPVNGYDWASVLWRAVKSLGAFAWIVTIIGFGSRPKVAPQKESAPAPQGATRRPSPVSRMVAYASEAFLPFYVLHQTVIVAISYYVVRWSAPGLIKYLAISMPALALSLLIYEFAVRRWGVMRWLLGMRAKATKGGL